MQRKHIALKQSVCCREPASVIFWFRTPGGRSRATEQPYKYKRLEVGFLKPSQTCTHLVDWCKGSADMSGQTECVV